MFRGFHIKEIRLLLALLCGVFAGMLFMAAREDKRQPATLSGPITENPPGVIARPTPVPSPAPTKRESKPSSAAAAPSASPAPSPSPAALLPGGLIDLNLATADDLELLPSIGPSKAADILAERDRRGGFRKLDDLLDVPGIGEKTLDRMRPHLVLRTPPTGAPAAGSGSGAPAASPSATPLPMVRVNVAGAEELMTLKGVGEVLAARILEDRQLNGPYRRADDLLRVKGIGPSFLEKNGNRLRFD